MYIYNVLENLRESGILLNRDIKICKWEALPNQLNANSMYNIFHAFNLLTD